jgi:hypothetical protein
MKSSKASRIGPNITAIQTVKGIITKSPPINPLFPITKIINAEIKMQVTQYFLSFLDRPDTISKAYA